MNRSSHFVFGLIALLILTQFAWGADFAGIGLPSRFGDASPDGQVIAALVGSSDGSSRVARWTAQAGLEILESPPTAGNATRITTVADDGSAIIGQFRSSSGQTTTYRWTETSGFEPFTEAATLAKLSADGQRGVGWLGAGAEQRAVRWSPGAGSEPLPLPIGALGSLATDATDNQTGIVGSIRYPGEPGAAEAFRWTEADGMVGLGDLPGGNAFSGAAAISADGRVIVGESSSAASWPYNEAFRWTEATGMTPLGGGPAVPSFAADVSSDGSLIVGLGTANDLNFAFLWSAESGLRPLKQVLLEEFGLGSQIAGWQLTSATFISDDGTVVAGNGRNPSGLNEAWVAHIPEPSAGLLAGLAAASFALVCRTAKPKRRDKGAPAGPKSGGASCVACAAIWSLLAASLPTTVRAESLIAKAGEQVLRSTQLIVGYGEELHASGAGTLVNVTPHLVVDGGTIQVDDGAWLQSSSEKGTSTRLVDGNAKAVVSGAGSTWTVGGNLDVGAGGTAHLSILDGGKVISGGKDLRTGVSTAKSTALVDGTGSTWLVTGYFEIGDAGEGHLTIDNGGVVVSGLDGNRSRVSGGGLSPNNASTALVRGTGSKWIINAGFEVGDTGEAHLVIEKGGQIVSGINGERTRVNGGLDPNEPASTAVVDGAGSSWQIGGDFVVGAGRAQLSILNGGRVFSGQRGVSALSSYNSREVSVVVDGAGSLWDIAGDLSLTEFNPLVEDGPPTTTLRVNDGATVSALGRLSGVEQSLIDLDQGIVRAASVAMQGVVRGTGTIQGDVVSSGLLDVGHSLGRLDIAGALQLQSAGIIAIELGRSAEGAAVSDLLAISGAADIAGTVEVKLLDGFQPRPGDEFTLLEYGKLSNGAANLVSHLSLPALNPSLAWRVVAGKSDLRLSVKAVPEPATALLAGVAGGLLAIRRLRNQSKTRPLKKPREWGGRAISRAP